MSLWEYKVITSGKGGFVSPALMEKFLNDLGKDEWEIIAFHTQPENLLAFTGLARRSTQRDWTLADAAAAAAKVEADKLRQEFEAKFKGASAAAPLAEERPESVIGEKAAPEDGFRKPIDTSRDDDPDAPEDEKEEWDKLGDEDALPTFFEAIRPHMRRNQRGPGMSVGTEYLAKKWDLTEDDIKGALVECGFVLPEDEDSKAVYLEYDGDLFWLNINRRGELWLNTKEKPRPVFRAVQGQRVTVEEPAEAPAAAAPSGDQPSAKPVFEPKPRREQREQRDQRDQREPREQSPAADATPGAPLPEGIALLEKIRPLMRRNRRGPGGSGSFSFLARALKCSEADLSTAFTGLGLVLPATPADKSTYAELDGDLWWLNQDSRGGVWINGREKKEGETAANASAPAPNEFAPTSGSAPTATTPAAPAAQVEPLPLATGLEPQSTAQPGNVFPAVRLLLKETKTGSVAGKLERVAEELGKSADELLNALTAAGLKVPEKSREKPVFVEHAGEIFWLNRNAKDELWVNAKTSKFSDKKEDGDEGEADGGDDSAGEKSPRRGGGGGRSRKKTD
ncbi:MAG TPA: hypothetical protein VHO24_15565 [Opitutaceae bacterium]|nr:hypothetical protein [Opitutaceae bacterium]